MFSYPVNSLKTFNKEWQKLGMKILAVSTGAAKRIEGLNFVNLASATQP